ncbi:hypothetical protein B0J11DRAFT_571642 [Dendryphion nanum]|uniref:BTB domain-containing protein n=1 Tax=Dendryphion nanum TaxID=256645 RepID=A0A9P9DAW6_9PLEO|nr:hypothetical protein B0J11DRAFT_571642 [Dendryphion nanum]
MGDSSLSDKDLSEIEHTLHASDAHNRPELNYKQYYNNPVYSDITIRYGLKGERIFYGHKIVLASHSRWFVAALEGNFRERDAKEITLQNDDPTAIERMLEWMYDSNGIYIFDNTPQKVTSTGTLYKYLHLFLVTDKYDVPELRDDILCYLYGSFRCIWQAASSKSVSANNQRSAYVDELICFIDQIYKFPSLVIRDILSSMFQAQDRLNNGMMDMVHELARKHARFAQDYLINMMGRARPKEDKLIRWTFVYEARCGKCQETWVWPGLGDNCEAEFCPMCGADYNTEEDRQSSS